MFECIQFLDKFKNEIERLEADHLTKDKKIAQKNEQISQLNYEKNGYIETIESLKSEQKRTLKDSLFLSEKNIKSFTRKYLARLLKIWNEGREGDEFEMCFESLTQSLEYSFEEKKQLYGLLFD